MRRISAGASLAIAMACSPSLAAQEAALDPAPAVEVAVARENGEGGVRLMQVGSPEAYRAISAAAEMRHDNRDKITACEKAAFERKKEVRCTIMVGHPQKKWFDFDMPRWGQC